jgi:amidase
MNDTRVATAPQQHIPIGDLKYTLSQFHAPVARVRPSEVFEVATELNIGGHNILSLEDRVKPDSFVIPFVNPATGPIYIEGAKPGHMLRIRLHQVDLVGYGFTALWPGVGIFPDWGRQKEFGVQSHVVRVADGIVHWSDDIKIPAAPMVGVIGTAPWVESVSTIDNGPHGGNLDVQEMGPGCRVYLPIAVDDALFYLGDCHAVQGDGELCGIGAIEIRTQTTVRLDLAPKFAGMVWPRIETADHIGAVACARPLEDAFRLSVEELVKWMVSDYGFVEHEAMLLLGQVAEARCTQLANPKYTYITKIAKRYLGS